MRDITKHIIHCSDSLYGDVIEIRKWHLARGWRDVGYHFIIRRDGEIEIGRMLTEVGAHCRGFNAESIGTCLVGKDGFTQQQFESLQRLHDSLLALFPSLTVHEHREFNAYKTCPNFCIKEVLKNA